MSFDPFDVALPHYWLNNSNFHISEIPPAQHCMAAALLRVGIEAIPPLEPYLHRENIVVCLYRGIEINGVFVDGAYAHGVICMSVGAPNSGIQSASHIQAILCHEVSSFAWRRCNGLFPTVAWQRLNPTGFAYYEHASDWMRAHPHLDTPSTDELTAGFFRPYCRSTIENDFNVVSSILLPSPAYCIQQSRDYPRLHQKVLLAAQFWATILPDLKEYFKDRADIVCQ